jgi:EmrB/QacA subfamily drug resistance transporter
MATDDATLGCISDKTLIPSVPAVLGGALVALFTASLTNTIIGIALPTIAGELGGQDQVAWVAAAALLTMTASTPVWGKLSDRRGPRPLLLVAIAVFVVASLVAGLAGSMSWLIVGRALQGVGSGGILALTNALVAGSVPARERGRYTGWFGAAFGTASVAGPLVGGLLVALPGAGWRWCFLGVVPVALVAAALVRLAPDRRPPRRSTPLDHLGAALIAGSAAALVLLLSGGGTVWPWASPTTGALAVATVALTVLAVLRERRAADPILSVRLFADPTFTLACAASFLMGTVMFAGIIYLPQYLQVVRGHGATTAGLLMLPQVGTTIVASTLTGRLITRTGRWKVFPVTGCTLLTLGAAGLAPLGTDTPMPLIAVAMAVLGAGTGMTQQVLVLVAQEAVEPADLGVASSAATFTRALGGAVGVAAFGALIAARLRADLPAALAAAGLPAGEAELRGLLGTPERIAALPAGLADAVRTSYTAGLQETFLLAVPLGLGALLAAVLTRNFTIGADEPART